MTHFTLRPFTLNDLESLVKHANNPNIANNLTDRFPYPYTAAHGKTFIEFANINHPRHVFAIDINGEAVGGIGVHPQTDIQRKNAELGYWLSESFWGQGIMSEAVKQMIDYGFKTFDINRIFARPYEHNIASQKILEKTGFVLEARLSKTLIKNNEYLDELIYAIRK